MMTSVVFAGSGPSALYAMHALLNSSVALSVTIVESSANVGFGNPYDPAKNAPAMLANIASVEVPPVFDTLADWLLSCDDAFLASVGVRRSDITDRAFFPRIVLGHYYAAQLRRVRAALTESGQSVVFHKRRRVLDIMLTSDGVTVRTNGRNGRVADLHADLAVISTGHGLPVDTPTGLLEASYPLRPLADGEERIGILGSSLSAIDVAVGLAVQRGNFTDDRTYSPHPHARPLSITMMSRRGLLPEADFYAPLPYPVMAVFNQIAVDAEINAGRHGLLDRIFALLMKQVEASDPAVFAERFRPDCTVESFAARYYGDRVNGDPFDHARRNLEDMERSYAARETSAWRYTLLSAHEILERAVPALDARDSQRFDRCLKGVFVDNYAAVPHASIKRLLALRAAGILELVRIPGTYEIEKDGGEIVVNGGDFARSFHAVFNARGQRWKSVQNLPFPSLRFDLLLQARNRRREDHGEAEAVPFNDAFSIDVDNQAQRLFITAVPYMLKRLPFSQGLTAAAAIGRKVGEAIVAAAEGRRAIEPGPSISSLIEAVKAQPKMVAINGRVTYVA